VEKQSKLLGLVERLYSGPSSLSSAIRDIHIEDLKHDDQTWLTYASLGATLFLLLLRTTRLQAFSMNCTSSIRIGLSHMRCLSQVCSTTLTRLSLVVRYDADGIFPLVNTLFNLRTLHLRFRDGSVWEHSLHHPLKLPNLSDLRWLCDFHPYNDRDMLVFLARCAFGPACRVDLLLAFLRPENALLLMPLFTAHDFAAVKVYMPPDCVAALGPGIMRARTVDFQFCAPPVAILRTGVMPAVIKLGHSPSQRSQVQLWEFLCSLCTAMPADKTMILQMQFFRHDLPFRWSGPCDAKYESFAKRLKPMAETLHTHGVFVVDEHGIDVTGSVHLS
jgi:hypothetical protein